MDEVTIDLKSLSQTAIDAVALKFNPSGLPHVDKLKFLAAAFITAIEECGKGRAAAVAITHAETASMWAVKAAIQRSTEN